MTAAADQVRHDASRSAFWAFAGAIGERAIRFGIFVLLARFVRPAELGLVALAMLLIDLLQGQLDAGLSQVLVRLGTVEDDQYEAAFWASVASGLAVAALVLLASAALRVAGGAGPLPLVVAALAASPAIQALGLIHHTRIVRGLGFRALTGRTVVASIVSGAIGIALAAAGWGVWALVCRTLLFTAASTAIVWLVDPWRPRRRCRWSAISSLLPDSLRLMGASLLGWVNARGFDLAAGLAVGAAALASLRVAGQVTTLLIEVTAGPFAVAAFATLSRHRDEREARSLAFVHLSRAAAVVMYPAFFGLIAVSGDLLPWLFGARWQGAAALMPILALVVAPVHFQVMLRAALFASGRTDRLLQWELAQGVSTVVAGLAGAPWGLMGIAIAATVHLYALVPLGVAWLRRDAAIEPALLLRSIVPALVAAAVMAAVVIGVRPVLLHAPLSSAARLAALIGLGVLTYGVLALPFAGDLMRDALRRRGRWRGAAPA